MFGLINTTMTGPIQANTALGKHQYKPGKNPYIWRKKNCWIGRMKISYLYYRKVKRKQALVETNLPGITLPTEMARGFICPLLITILGVVYLKKTQNQHLELSDQVGAITNNITFLESSFYGAFFISS